MLVEIFKEEIDVCQNEVEEIQKSATIVKQRNDKANCYHAYAIEIESRDKADKLVSTLNEKYDDSWYLGAEDEEYVDVD